MDQSRLVIGSWDHTVRVWAVETHQQIGNSFEGHTEEVSCVATSDDGRHVVSGSKDNTVRLWDLESGEQVCDPLIGHTRRISEVSFMGESGKLVSSSFDGTVRAWDLKRKRIEAPVDKQRSSVSSGSVNSIAFSPNGRFAVSGSWNGTLQIWDPISGQAVGEPLLNENSHTVLGVAITPDSRFVISVSRYKSVHVWDLQTREVLQQLESHTDVVQCVSVTPNGESAVTGSVDITIRVWDLKSMDGSHVVLEGHSAGVKGVFISDDGNRIISVDCGDDIFVWDIETHVAMKRTSSKGAKVKSRRQILRLVEAGTVHVDAGFSERWDEIVHGEESEARVLRTLEAPIIASDISPDKQTMCVGLWDGRVGFLKLYHSERR